MKKIIIMIALLSLSLNAELLSFKTLNNEYIKVDSENGKLKFRNKMYQNKDVLFFFFGRDCPVCKGQVPDVLELYNKKSRSDFEIIGVHGQAVIGDPALRDYATKEGMKFNILSFDDDIKIINYMKSNGMWKGTVPHYLHVDKLGNLKTMTIDEAILKFTLN